MRTAPETHTQHGCESAGRDELANGWTRTTQPGDWLPVTPDPAEGVSGLWIGLGLVGAIAAVAACWHAVARVIGGAA